MTAVLKMLICHSGLAHAKFAGVLSAVAAGWCTLPRGTHCGSGDHC